MTPDQYINLFWFFAIPAALVAYMIVTESIVFLAEWVREFINGDL